MSDPKATELSPTPNRTPAEAKAVDAHPAALHPDHPDHFEEGEEKAPPGTTIMAVVRWTLVLLMGLVAAASVLYFIGLHQDDGGPAPTAAHEGEAEAPKVRYQCPMHAQVIQDHPGDCPICNMKLVKVEVAPKKAAEAPKTRYQCPMHPSIVQDEPGDCPICNMKLVPVTVGEKHEHDEDGVPGLTPVQLSADRVQLSGVRVAEVMRERIAQELRTVGFVTADETSLALVTTRFAGWIEELPVSTTGERVKAGQVLATIYSPELLAAQNELLNAERWRKAAPAEGQAEAAGHGHVGALSSSLADDARRKLELLGVSSEELEEIERTGKPIHAMKLRAPANGYVTKKNAVRGSYVDSGATLFEVADLGHVWVLADVYEYDLAHVKVGQKATLKLVPYPDRTFTGRVEFIYPTIDPDTRTMRVRLHFSNGDLALRPGMYGDVNIERPPMDAVIVPQEALVDTGKYQYVFLALDEGKFVPRLVKTGRHAENHVEILKGLSAGDKVVTTANFLVDSESRLRATIEGFSGEPTGPTSQPASAGQHQHGEK